VFPFAPRPIKRGNIYLRFELIRHYRNRVAHHDAIWLGRPPGAKGGEASVLDQHAEVLEALQWMNPQVRDLLVAVDQLPGAYHGGWQGVLARLTDAKLPLP
jgi:hypothetical protein